MIAIQEIVVMIAYRMNNFTCLLRKKIIMIGSMSTTGKNFVAIATASRKALRSYLFFSNK
ncbi:MAG: hypothetical protein ACKPKO_00070 [Candidatus Fonsibacter sp.]